MISIKKTPIELAEKYELSHKLWGSDAYEHAVFVQLTYDADGFIVKFTVDGESDPLREKKSHLAYVHEDSCVEFFVNFTPEDSKHYINFEVNANGCMNVAFRTHRRDASPLEIYEIENLGITPELFDDHWNVTYKITFDFIKKYYPTFDIDTCEYIIGNFYKCGDLTEMPHYISYFKVGTEKPDYHRPEFFGKITVEH